MYEPCIRRSCQHSEIEIDRAYLNSSLRQVYFLPKLNDVNFTCRSAKDNIADLSHNSLFGSEDSEN